MERTEEGFAKRCLPLLIANQHGWHVLATHRVRARWTGGNLPTDVVVSMPAPADEPVAAPEPAGEPAVASATGHFGHGILTWTIPYLFRTPPGVNLLVRGPANAPKDGIAPLEGIVETDWCSATFTMNWKFTRPDVEVVFEPGEPICFLVPVDRGRLEEFTPRVEALDADPELAGEFHRWRASRHTFNLRLAHEVPQTGSPLWQRHYFQGTSVAGTPAPEHETRLALREFHDPTPPHPSPKERTDRMDDAFKKDDLPLLNRLIAGNPQLRETAALVKKISGSGKYPISSVDDLITAVGGPDSTFTFKGRTMSLREAKDFVPAHYFPITSEADLIAKLSDVQAKPAKPGKVPPPIRERIEVKWTTDPVVIPHDAPKPPALTSLQVHEILRDTIGTSGLARRPDGKG